MDNDKTLEGFIERLGWLDHRSPVEEFEALRHDMAVAYPTHRSALVLMMLEHLDIRIRFRTALSPDEREAVIADSGAFLEKYRHVVPFKVHYHPDGGNA